jgi:hypothetical protein
VKEKDGVEVPLFLFVIPNQRIDGVCLSYPISSEMAYVCDTQHVSPQRLIKVNNRIESNQRLDGVPRSAVLVFVFLGGRRMFFW